MNCQEAIEYLDKTIIFGIKPGLERIEALLNYLGDPHFSYPVIQITGTNGKTSVTKMLASILTALGFKTAAYTSPHLISYQERFSIDRELISQDDFAYFLSEIIPFIEKTNKKFSEPLTHFEILTALAFLYFSEAKVDVSVVEVGMGGRWDATSCTRPEVAVVTNVELDHTDRLGTTLLEIATEKAYIIKRGVRLAIVGKLKKSPISVVEKRAEEEKVPLRVYGKDFDILSKGIEDRGQKVSLKGFFGNYEDLIIPALGDFQAENAAIAVASAEGFCEKTLPFKALKDGLLETDFSGRLEILRTSPLVILDGAHNPAGAERLAHTIKESFNYHNLILILTILKDKDIKGIFKELVPLASFVILSENKSERSSSCKLLKEEIKGFKANYICEKNLKKAIEIGLSKAKNEDILLIAGSLYAACEVKEYFAKL